MRLAVLFISKQLFKACHKCNKRYPACQDTCPDVSEDREEKQRRYAERKLLSEIYAADMANHDRIVKKMQKGGHGR